MHTLNATSPLDFPKQCIIFDREFAQRHPDKSFYLRVQVSPNEVQTIELEGALSLPQARTSAVRQGYAPTHWMEVSDHAPVRLPGAS